MTIDGVEFCVRLPEVGVDVSASLFL